ncbi:MAG: archaetidylserine decarboxylase [Gammaproteobacteria bacterium]|jgi:phosphatidylserine decarboxylase
MSASLSAAAQFLLPQKLLGHIVYRLARSERAWLKNLLIRGFCRIYPIDLGEAESPDAEDYASFNAFFTRSLRPGARPLPPDDDVIVSPADGRLTEFGRLDGSRLLQAKGKSYTLEALLAEQPDLIESFRGGSFLTIYLAPHNYHRVHAPIQGHLDRGRYVPGKRFSVNARTAASIDGLYCRNERVALWLSTSIGYAVVVMVGALNVSSLSSELTGEIESGRERLLSSESAPELERGAELGRFNLGSTVVLLFPRATVEWDESLVAGQSLLMGQALGRISQGSTS